MKILSVILILALSSCAFVDQANEFKGRGRLDILFPFGLIPGLDSVLPHFVIDLSGGFEWHNDEQQHRFEMDKLKFQREKEEKDNAVFKDALLRAADPSVVVPPVVHRDDDQERGK